VLAFVSLPGAGMRPTVFLSSRLPLPGYFGSKSTLSGLAGSDTPGLNAKVALDPPSTIFGPYARWFQASGQLVLITQRQSGAAGAVYNVSAPTLALSKSLPGLLAGTGRAGASFATLDAAGPLIARAPLLVPGFQGRALGATGGSAGQPRDEAAGAANTVHVTLVPNLAMQCPLELTLSGLLGGGAPSGNVSVDVAGSAQVGAWDRDAGTLIVGLPPGLGAGSPLTLRFAWTNGPLPPLFSDVRVAASCVSCSLELAQAGGPWILVDGGAAGGAYYFPAVALPDGPLGGRRELEGQHV
jgi:hypothetical protein